jgi:hypothetical protein
MDTTALIAKPKINRWLPYWAVLQSDLRQTIHGWVYRVWVLATLLAAIGFLLYRVGVDREAGIMQSASTFISDLLRWSVVGSIAPIIVLAGGCISSERGIMADSVLSRGISRYQYFLGKWHARLVTVVGTYLVFGLIAITGSFFFLHEDIKILGSLIALVTVIVLLAGVTTCGVTASAMCNSTVMGVAILWMVLYGVGFGLSLLPVRYPTPDYVLTNLPNILRGLYNFAQLGRLILWTVAGSILVALVGMCYFSRRDV